MWLTASLVVVGVIVLVGVTFVSAWSLIAIPAAAVLAVAILLAIRAFRVRDEPRTPEAERRESEATIGRIAADRAASGRMSTPAEDRGAPASSGG